jgi:hypothetical protein
MGELRAGLLIALTAASAAITPPVAQAQRVRGTLTDSATGEPVTGAVVSVLDSAGQFLSRTIADDKGRYAAARLRGSRTIHIVRIGYRPVDATIAASDSTMDFRLSPIASRLTAVTATEGRVCPGKPGASQALELWEQARNGLLASVVARESNPPRLRIRTYWRTRDPIRKRIENDSSHMKDIVADRSYVAARPAWAFEAEGYMREHLGGERDYFAPDEAVLLDPSFAATHCMHVVAADARHDNQIGIGFEPADIRARDTVVDLAGTLWLDSQKPSLRSFEFEYTNLESRARGSGGSLTFATMPNGVPMIVRWDIHSAILAIDADYSANVRRNPPPRPLRANVRVLGYQETGGETGFAIWPDGTHWNLGLSKIFGVVTDQGGARIPNARVWFTGGRDTVVADEKGEFDFKFQFPGNYVLVASDSSLAAHSIGRNIPTRVFLTETRDVPVQLILHPRSEILPLVCPASSYKPGTGVVFARLLNADGSAAEHARVEVETTARLVVRDSVVVSDTLVQPVRRLGEAGDDGQFIVCGAGLDRPLRVRGLKNGLAGEARIDHWIDEIASLTIVLKPAAAP